MYISAARGHRPIAKYSTVVDFHENVAIYFFHCRRNCVRSLRYKIRHTYALCAIFLASFSQNRSASRPRHRFLRSCLLLTYEQALIEARPGYYYCTRDVRNARARTSRTHPNREVGSRNANTASSCSCCESRYDRLLQLRRARRLVFCSIVNSSSEELRGARLLF